MALAITTVALVAACGNNAKGVVIERYDAVGGVAQSLGECSKTEWLIVVDQGDKARATDRFRQICMPFAEATKYPIGERYP